MASFASRQALRAATRATRASSRGAFFSSASIGASSRTAFRQSAGAGRRFYSSEAPKPKQSNSLWIWLGVGAVGAAGAYFYQQGGVAAASKPHGLKDYQAVYNEIAKRLQDHDEYDDGSYGPVLLRLAWHASGTYDKATGTGGSNGATMRFAPESQHGANNGLINARDFLEPVKKKFPWISYSDLWVLGGVCAIQEMLGPAVPYRPGRADKDLSSCTPDGRLPDASQGSDHIRNIFYRMGFDDREIVALLGAHAVGRCHVKNSGFDGPWTFSPTVLTNDFYKLLLEAKWEWKRWSGNKQYVDSETHSLMMLPTDMALVQDKKFKPVVQAYAADNDVFFKDFSAAVLKLFELGVPFTAGTENERWIFKTLE